MAKMPNPPPPLPSPPPYRAPSPPPPFNQRTLDMIDARTVMSGVREALDKMREVGGVPYESCCVTLYVAPNLWCEANGRHILYYELKRHNPEIDDIECAQHLENGTVLLMPKKEECSCGAHEGTSITVDGKRCFKCWACIDKETSDG